MDTPSRRKPESVRAVTEVIIGDVCVFRFPNHDERRLVANRFVGVVDGQECVKVRYLDGSESVYANWVKLLVEARN